MIDSNKKIILNLIKICYIKIIKTVLFYLVIKKITQSFAMVSHLIPGTFSRQLIPK